MIPLEHAVWVADGGAVEGTHLDSGPAKRPPVPPRCRPAPDPVIQDPYLDPLASLLQKDLPERAPYGIVSKDIVLEMDVPLGPRDRFQPGVERDGSVELETNRVALDFRRAGRSLERFLRQTAKSARGGPKDVAGRLRLQASPPG